MENPVTATVEIKSPSGRVLYTHEGPAADTLREALIAAVGRGVNLYGANLKGANLYGANLEGATLEGATLKGATLYGANLEGACLKGVNLKGATLYGANLEGATLEGATLEGANLEGANLKGACLYGANLEGANLKGACLYGATLYGANLKGANLYGANLEGATLKGANLEGATLYGATLYGATLYGAYLRAFQIPQEGELVVWKKLSCGVLAQLRIPADAKRTATPIGRKCRAERAEVLRLVGGDGNDLPADARVASQYDEQFFYAVGDVVAPQGAAYCDDIRQECRPGVHFFLTKAEAQAY